MQFTHIISRFAFPSKIDAHEYVAAFHLVNQKRSTSLENPCGCNRCEHFLCFCFGVGNDFATSGNHQRILFHFLVCLLLDTKECSAAPGVTEQHRQCPSPRVLLSLLSDQQCLHDQSASQTSAYPAVLGTVLWTNPNTRTSQSAA